jgi:hypothetical protein
MVTAKSRRVTLARLSAGHLPQSPYFFGFLRTNYNPHLFIYSHPRPTSAFALIPPSPPFGKTSLEGEKVNQNLKLSLGWLKFPHRRGLRPLFSDVNLPRPASELDSRRMSRSDLSIHERPPLVTSAVVAETLIGPSKMDWFLSCILLPKAPLC